MLHRAPHLDFSALPSTAFIDPTGKNRTAIETLLRQVTEQILDYLTGAASHTPLPKAHELSEMSIPEMPTGISPLLEQLKTVLATAMNPAHPGYMGHMDPLPTTFSIIGDWVVAALNNK
ncbi:MAG: aspartate aminotransferase family protein, partial [Leptolyngbya sp. SIO1D8]|nr:aspartate aminotransferase family protein [Leptolyngbya sp. SIO1D8]